MLQHTALRVHRTWSHTTSYNVVPTTIRTKGRSWRRTSRRGTRLSWRQWTPRRPPRRPQTAATWDPARLPPTACTARPRPPAARCGASSSARARSQAQWVLLCPGGGSLSRGPGRPQEASQAQKRRGKREKKQVRPCLQAWRQPMTHHDTGPTCSGDADAPPPVAACQSHMAAAAPWPHVCDVKRWSREERLDRDGG